MRPLLLALVMVMPLGAQTPTDTFDVVSVKRNRSGDANSQTRPRPGGGLQVTNNTLRQMIRNAYQREDYLIVGGPSWVGSERFDIVGTAAGDVTFDVMQRRMKALLADRFRLVVREETRQMPVYEMTRRSADRLGPQLRPSTIDCRPTTTGAARPAPIVPPGAPAGEPPLCGIRRRNGLVLVAGGPMEEFSRALSGMLGQTVVDRTGITGTVDLTLTWDADLTAGGGVSLFAAAPEQLGLRLEASRGPVSVLVIDRAELPAED